MSGDEPISTRSRRFLRSFGLPERGTGARRLAPIVLLNAVGNGLFFSISALYFTTSVGVTATQLALGLTIGGALGALAAVPVGRMAEKHGPRVVTIVIWLLEAVGMIGYTRVRSFVTFLPLVIVVVLLDRSSGSGYRVLIARMLVEGDKAQARSFLRAIANTGMGTGAAVGAISLTFNTRSAYVVAILINSVSFLIAALLLARLSVPAPAGTATASGGESSRITRASVLRDRPYLAMTFLSMLLTLQFGVLEIGLPLWVVQRTDAPNATIAASLVLNTALIALLQVRLSKGSDDLSRAARLCRWSGLLLAASCIVFALAAGVSPLAAVVIVLSAALLQTFAEMYFSIGTMALSYDLVPEQEGHGAYHGVFQSGYIIALLLAPLIITNTALRFGTGGWIALAAVFAAAGMLLVPVGRWAQRTRAAVAAAEPAAVTA